MTGDIDYAFLPMPCIKSSYRCFKDLSVKTLNCLEDK